MWLLIDPAAVARLERTANRIVNDEPRRYYCTRPDDARLCLVVTRNQSLEDMAGMVVDANIGWDDGTAGFVHPGDELLLHSKVTIYAVLLRHRGRAERSLSHVLDAAPTRFTP